MKTNTGALADHPMEKDVRYPATSPGFGAARSLSRLRLASRRSAALVALAIIAATSSTAVAVAGPEVFGPGKVACQDMGAGRFDCLLTSLRISENGNDVATFSLASLPPKERVIFRKWCSTAADDCTVQLQGTRQARGGSRLSAVTSIHWTRPMSPKNQDAARIAGD
jgi:hypothetical protein